MNDPRAIALAAGPLGERIEALISTCSRGFEPLPPEVFNALALELFRHQYTHNAAYRRFCQSAGASPEGVVDWRLAPAVVTDAFKVAHMACFPPEEAAVSFLTSGTTQGRRGQHPMRSLRWYRAALREPFERFCLPERRPIRMLLLTPPFEEERVSSLSFMIDEVAPLFGSGHTERFMAQGHFDAARAWEVMERCEREGEGVFLLGTAFSFVHLLDASPGRAVTLPPGSRCMETGGFKGRSREIPREQLRALMAQRLGLHAPWIVGEYGMTELSSQLYEGALRARLLGEAAPTGYVPPPWLGVTVVDPLHLTPLPVGELGLVRFFDLANVESVAAIQTADLGRLQPGGSLTLHGRAGGAELRGCSLQMEEWLERREREGA